VVGNSALTICEGKMRGFEGQATKERLKMTEMTSYAPGTPSWVDLGSPDIDASVAFYGDIFGWDVPESENAEQTGGYRQAMLRGKAAAGMMPLMQEGQPPAWSTYVSVEDADATAAAVRDAGGKVMAEPMDVMDLGRMAIFADPSGAVFGIWQPGTFVGAEVVNEPNSFSWNELNTRDPDQARSFYAAVFGWVARDMDMGDAGTYTTFRLPDASEDDESVGGLLDMRAQQIPDEVPEHWMTYFTVEDLDGEIEKTKGAGGSVTFGPMELPIGRLAILIDPQGAAFGIFESTADSD
jgi:predicted enzyme related to lactoylglutathione lyase